MNDNEAVLNRFFVLHSLLIEAQEEFGEDGGQRLVAESIHLAREHGAPPAEVFYRLRDVVRRQGRP